MKKKWIRNIFKGFCLTSALFVFQACYGTGPDIGNDLYVYGKVTSKKTGKPIKNVRVSVVNQAAIESSKQYELMQYDLTREDGTFGLYINDSEKLYASFQANDSKYADKDTLFSVTNSTVILNIELEEE